MCKAISSYKAYYTNILSKKIIIIYKTFNGNNKKPRCLAKPTYKICAK